MQDNTEIKKWYYWKSANIWINWEECQVITVNLNVYIKKTIKIKLVSKSTVVKTNLYGKSKKHKKQIIRLKYY